jgi:bifunctional non-homologous end joining protein LigD
MGLEEYRRKRDASQTPEPVGDEPVVAGGATRTGVFVVHLHAASHRHYDLRLEAGGVLASFAVPKGPALDPADKRLAMRTEDHPLAYLDFEAVIPEGNYGAGAMIVWDRGRVRYLEGTSEEGLVKGKLDFVLEGMKLGGRFALVFTGDRPGQPKGSWLLVKKEDDASRAAIGKPPITERAPRSILSGLTVEELPRARELEAALVSAAAAAGAPLGVVDARRTSPMLCSLSPAPEVAEGHAFELKLDGIRLLAQRSLRGSILTSRRGRDETHRYPEIARAVDALPVSSLVLDGEVVAFDERGVPSFQRLGRRMNRDDARDVRAAMLDVPVLFVAFDVLALGPRDLRGLPLRARKALLARLLPASGVLRSLAWLEGDGRPLFTFVRQHRLEGVVVKDLAAPYREGPRRTTDWIKWKTERDEDFVVVGHTRGESGRQRLGALDLASYEGDALVYRGKVGSGLSEPEIDRLLERLSPLEASEPALRGPLGSAPRGRTHVRPELVVRVRFLGYTEQGHVRFPVYLGVRDDVGPKDCRAAPHGVPHDAPDAARELEPSARQKPEERRAVVTNRKKVLFPPDEGAGPFSRALTKGDLVDYYDAIADVALVHLRDRPVVMVRYPDGIGGKSFFQWNVPHTLPSWVPTAILPPEQPGEEERRVFLVQDRETLRFVANLAAVVLHVLPQRVRPSHGEGGLPVHDRERTDYLTIDFDVGEARFRDAATLARTLRGLAETAGLRPFLKTSGQSGLHVLMPVGGVPTATARILAELLGRVLVMRHPELATMERGVERRGSKVYVDTGQTGGHRTIVAPYSVRARPGGPVSTPLRWLELDDALDPARFSMLTVPARVAREGDPMSTLYSELVDVASIVPKLASLLTG